MPVALGFISGTFVHKTKGKEHQEPWDMQGKDPSYFDLGGNRLRVRATCLLHIPTQRLKLDHCARRRTLFNMDFPH